MQQSGHILIYGVWCWIARSFVVCTRTTERTRYLQHRGRTTAAQGRQTRIAPARQLLLPFARRQSVGHIADPLQHLLLPATQVAPKVRLKMQAPESLNLFDACVPAFCSPCLPSRLPVRVPECCSPAQNLDCFSRFLLTPLSSSVLLLSFSVLAPFRFVLLLLLGLGGLSRNHFRQTQFGR